MTRLEKIYREKVVPVLQKEFNYSSSMQLPGIEKISLNIGLGAASQNNKLMNFALPRVRDFRGIPDRGFDGRGNFTLGIKEHTIFPEMEADRVENPKGMNITIVTSATTDKEGKFLLDQLGMPFRK